MNMKIYHTNFVSPVDYQEVNRYDLLLDGNYICSTARGLPYELPELLERFLKYIKMNPKEILMSYTQRSQFFKKRTKNVELIFDRVIPDIGLMIKEMIIEQKLKDIEQDFV